MGITIAHRMCEVAIVGAGALGGLTAHALARGHAARVVRLIDDRGRVAEGKALDISQAAPVERFATFVTGSSDLAALTGAGLVVIADRADGHEWQGDDAMALVRRIRAHAPHALLLCAGASHRELVERGARELHIPRQTIFGSASEALLAAAKAMVALELDLSPQDVSFAVLGVPPGHIVIGWNNATAAGLPLTGMITPSVRRQLTARISALWPPGTHALASAACKTIGVLTGQARRPVTCFVAPDDRLGVRTRTSALPIRLGRGGDVEVLDPVLSAAERTALDNAIML